jgi:dipeptidyl aminopeptidase/acylaminoacyl peptidase
MEGGMSRTRVVVAAVAVVVAGCSGSLDPRGQEGSGGSGIDAGVTGTGGTGGQPVISGIVPGPPIEILATCGPQLHMSGATGKIAFDSNRQGSNRDIYMMNADGTELTRLTTDAGIAKEPAFSPDGKQLSFSSDRSGTSQIYLLDLSTMQVTQVTDIADGADESSFSHDGSLIAFHSGASVWVIHPDGAGATLVATGLSTFNAYFWPHFSADDSELLFDRNNEIDAAHLDGTGFRWIVQNWTTTEKSPAVSPSGVDVAYAVWCDIQLSVWTTPFSTTTEPCMGTRVTPVTQSISQRPTWGPENLIAYERVDPSTNVGSIAVISTDPGSFPCVFPSQGADDRNPAWSF